MVEVFFREKSNLEEITITSTIDEIMKKYEENFNLDDMNEELKKYFIWDYELLRCHEKTMDIENSKGNRLGEYMKYTNGYKYPDIENF